jgi:hypothetical protein
LIAHGAIYAQLHVKQKRVDVKQGRMVASGFVVVLPEERVLEITEGFPKMEGNGDTEQASTSISITTLEQRLLSPPGSPWQRLLISVLTATNASFILIVVLVLNFKQNRSIFTPPIWCI